MSLRERFEDDIDFCVAVSATMLSIMTDAPAQRVAEGVYRVRWYARWLAHRIAWLVDRVVYLVRLAYAHVHDWCLARLR